MSEPHKRYFLSFIKDPATPEEKGAMLEPLSMLRRAAVDALGARFFRLDDAEWEEMINKGRYPGMVADTAIFLWVMTLPAAAVTKAMMSPSAGLRKAMEWAEDHKARPGDRNFNEAQGVLCEILQDLTMAAKCAQEAAQAEDDEDEDESQDEEDGLGEA